MKIFGLYIDGRFLKEGASIPAVSPASERVLAHVRLAGRDEVHLAVACARRVADSGSWSSLPVAQRAGLLLDLADAIEENADLLARVETEDTGLPLTMTRGGHVPRAIEHFRFFAQQVQAVAEPCFSQAGAYVHFVERVPVGVVAIFAPWNAPLSVASMHIAAALATGNVCVLKPSERASLSCCYLAEIASAVGVPAGVLNVLTGDEGTGRSLAEADGIDAVCFVGGTETGREVAAESGRRLRAVTLELGGKAPTVVLKDCDLSTALDGALLSAYANNGEVCTAGSRILVEAPIYEEFAARAVERASHIVVGDPLRDETELGPLIDEEHSRSFDEHLERARAEGARVLLGGEAARVNGTGWYRRPALLGNVTRSMQIFHEEVFGPLATLTRVADEDDAIAAANESPYGLAATVYCGDASRGLRVASRLQAGVVAINSPIVRDLRCPFGGVKASGIGRVGGRWSLEQFTCLKSTSIPRQGYTLPRIGMQGLHVGGDRGQIR